MPLIVYEGHGFLSAVSMPVGVFRITPQPRSASNQVPICVQNGGYLQSGRVADLNVCFVSQRIHDAGIRMRRRVEGGMRAWASFALSQVASRFPSLSISEQSGRWVPLSKRAFEG